MSIPRAKALAVVLVASVLTMMTAPLFAGPSHEVCDAMRHECAKIDAVASCCCGDQSDSNPSRVASVPTVAGTDSTHNVAVVTLTSDVLPTIATFFVHEDLPPLARPPDLPILFSDLRI